MLRFAVVFAALCCGFAFITEDELRFAVHLMGADGQAPAQKQAVTPVAPSQAVVTAQASPPQGLQVLRPLGQDAPSDIGFRQARIAEADAEVAAGRDGLAEDPAADGVVVGVLEFAAAQLGTPYLWGGTGPGGFDCSGLARAAFGAAGVALPRVAQDQFDAGPAVTGSTSQPGDLVYFGSGPTGVDHVGLYVGDGLMVDAPHTGAVVRVEAADWSGMVGATRPG